jgi:RNA:NAD 2'-phosphotransferase (TPT1/KptA family)
MATKTHTKKTNTAGKAPPPRETKISKVIAMLTRKQGATLDQMVKATGWQPHTTRAAMTGLRKKGHTIEREISEAGSVYRITASV